MNYLNDVLIYWLNYSTEGLTTPTLWIVSDQAKAPPKPQDATSFGYVRIIDAKPLSFGGSSQKYNPDTDKFDVKLRNYLEVDVHVEVNSKDQSAAVIADRIIAFLYDETIKEYFYTNNVGILSVPITRNLSSAESGQVRKRFIVELKFNIRSDYLYEVDRMVAAPVDFELQP